MPEDYEAKAVGVRTTDIEASGGFQESNSRFCQPSLRLPPPPPGTPGSSRLLSALALLLPAARERIASPPTGTAVSDPNAKEEPGGQRYWTEPLFLQQATQCHRTRMLQQVDTEHEQDPTMESKVPALLQSDSFNLPRYAQGSCCMHI
ncbi:hypothetical protein ACRRTK_024828 [Alexandromys fortis]